MILIHIYISLLWFQESLIFNSVWVQSFNLDIFQHLEIQIIHACLWKLMLQEVSSATQAYM